VVAKRNGRLQGFQLEGKLCRSRDIEKIRDSAEEKDQEVVGEYMIRGVYGPFRLFNAYHLIHHELSASFFGLCFRIG
jgi:hypothetical protein